MECVSLPLAPVDYSVFTASVWSWNCVPHYHTHYECCGSLKHISHALERSLFPATPVAIKLAGYPRFPFLWVLTYLGIYTVNYGYVNIKWHFSRIISRCQRCFLISAWFMWASPRSSRIYTATQVILTTKSCSLTNTFLSNLVTLWRGTFEYN